MIAVLFARADSYYKTLPECDVWDAERDARKWPGGCPVVAHPPCRAWGGLSHMAKPRHDEKDLARWAVAQVRQWGGVLEHPKKSKLWADQGLPRTGYDAYDGWTLPIFQSSFGHRAEKATLLYIVGCKPENIPDLPLQLGRATHVVGNGTTNHPQPGDAGYRPAIRHAEREHTPPELARWLLELAKRCTK
jgi:hypothetical protein